MAFVNSKNQKAFQAQKRPLEIQKNAYFQKMSEMQGSAAAEKN